MLETLKAKDNPKACIHLVKNKQKKSSKQTRERCCQTLISWSGLQGRIHVEAGRLTISKISLLDSGMYQCVADNEHGAAYASAELKVVGKQLACSVSFTMNWTEGRDVLSVRCVVSGMKLPRFWK